LEDNGVMEHLMGMGEEWILIWGVNFRLEECISALISWLLPEIASVLLQESLVVVSGLKVSSLPCINGIPENEKLVGVVWVPFNTLGLDLGIEFDASLPVVLSHGSWDQEDNECKNNDLENSMSKNVSPHDLVDN